MIILKLFWLFLQVGLFSFGSGYASLPVITNGASHLNISNVNDINNVFGLGGALPGPVALNAAVGIGYKTAGVPGALISVLGVTLPCIVLVVLAAKFFYALYHNKIMQSVLGQLGPIAMALIISAAIKLMLDKGILLSSNNHVISTGWNLAKTGGGVWLEGKSIALTVISFIVFTRTKVSALWAIVGGAIIGMLLF
jgi:chromate transporter